MASKYVSYAIPWGYNDEVLKISYEYKGEEVNSIEKDFCFSITCYYQYLCH